MGRLNIRKFNFANLVSLLASYVSIMFYNTSYMIISRFILMSHRNIKNLSSKRVPSYIGTRLHCHFSKIFKTKRFSTRSDTNSTATPQCFPSTDYCNLNYYPENSWCLFGFGNFRQFSVTLVILRWQGLCKVQFLTFKPC